MLDGNETSGTQVDEAPGGELGATNAGTGLDATGRRPAGADSEPLLAQGTAERAVPQGLAWDLERERDTLQTIMENTRAQREFLEHLVESAPVGIAVVRGPDHRFELVNPAYQAIPGITGMPMVGQTIAEVLPDVVAQGASDMVAEVYRTGQAAGVREYEAAMGPGRERTYWDVDHVPLHGPDGQVERVLILAQEITDQVLARRHAEDLATEAQQRAEELQAVFAALGDAVLVYDASGVVLKANPAAADTFGPELVGATWEEMARAFVARRPDGQPIAVDEHPVSRALRGQQVADERIMLTDALGQERTILVSAAPLLCGDEVSGAVAAWHDITPQTQAERALYESEEKLRKLFEILPVGISILDQDRNVLKANQALSRILDLSTDELLYGSYRERAYLTAEGMPFPPQDYPSARAFDEQKAIEDVEVGVVKEDGQRIWTSVSAVPVPFPDWKTIVVTADISQRKRIEEALREANQSLEALIQASPLAIIALDLDLNVTLWNPAAERIFGWSEREVLGNPYPLIPETKQEEFQGFLAQKLAGRVLSGTETIRHGRDGISIDVSIWTAPLYDAEGSIRNIMIVIADISERKRAEEALRHYAHEQNALYSVTSAVAATLEEEELLSVILEAVLPALDADAGWILLPEPSVGAPPRVVTSRGTSEGLSAAETILPLQDCPIYHDLSTGEIAVLEPQQVVDCPVLRATASGGSDLFSLVCVPLCVGSQVLGVLKIGWRRPYPHLAQSQSLLSTIGRQVGIALHHAQLYEAARQVDRLRFLSELDRVLAATLDPRKLAEVVLDHLRTHLDAPVASMLLLPPPSQGESGMQVFSAAHGWAETSVSSDDVGHWQAFLASLAEQRRPMPCSVEDLALLSGDFPPAWQEDAHGLLVPIRGEQDLLAMLALGRRADRPFTSEEQALAQVAARHAGQAMQNAQLYDELRHLIEEHERTRAQLIQSEKLAALGRLAASVAHEINNPLQAIENYLTLVCEEMDGSQRRDKLDRYLSVVKGELGRISAIVRRMRDYYRPAHERLQPTDLLSVLDSVLDLSGKELQHHNIEFTRLSSPELPLVHANPDHLKQVFLNLVLNAMDAMPTGGMLRITAMADVQLDRGDLPQPAVRVEISDTGHGIPPEIQARLFEPFFTTKEHGAGLGLSIVYNIIEAHNGRISVSSEEGVGTTFSILLPTAPS